MSLSERSKAISEIVNANTQLNRVFDFFNPAAMGRALDRVAFSQDEEVGLLVEMARNGQSEWVRLAALRDIKNRAKEALMLSGAMREVTGSQEIVDEDGRRTTMTAKSVALLSEAASTAMVPNDKMEIIDVEHDGSTSGGTIGDAPEKPAAGGDTDNPGAQSHDRADGHYPPAQHNRGLSAGG